MNLFGDPALVSGYEEWYQTAGRRADHLERALLGRLVPAFPQAQTALEVGCGTGHFTRWMTSQSLAADSGGAEPPELVRQAAKDGRGTRLGTACFFTPRKLSD